MFLNSIFLEFPNTIFSTFQYYLNLNDNDIVFFEEILLFNKINFNENKYLNFEKNQNIKPEIILLRNLKSKIYNQFLIYPQYICLMYSYIDGK